MENFTQEYNVILYEFYVQCKSTEENQRKIKSFPQKHYIKFYKSNKYSLCSNKQKNNMLQNDSAVSPSIYKHRGVSAVHVWSENSDPWHFYQLLNLTGIAPA